MTDLPRTVIVTGPLRSGTSLVGAVVHRLGWSIGPTIPAPMPPSFRSDFEEPELSLRLMHKHWLSEQEWKEYLHRRRLVSTALGFEGRICLKSPLLALCWSAVLRHAGDDAFVIRTYRNAPERIASVRAHPQLSATLDQAILQALHRVAPMIEIGYDLATEAPMGTVRSIASALGVEDDSAVAAAAALIGRPTIYPCPSSPQPLVPEPTS